MALAGCAFALTSAAKAWHLVSHGPSHLGVLQGTYLPPRTASAVGHSR